MIIVSDVKLPLETDFNNLKDAVSFKGVKVKSASLYRKSVDARKKNDVHFCCSVLIETDNDNLALKKIKNAKKFNAYNYDFKKVLNFRGARPVVVGFGPAGIFAAYILAKAGLCPIVLERGRDADSRTKDVSEFWAGGKLNTESNVQFGEGGAGAFSDGKLTTGIKDIRCRTVLNLLHKFGAQNDILNDAKPHIGTDVLVSVIKNIRNEIISLGGEVRFSNRMEQINIENGKLCSINVMSSDGIYTIYTDKLILAVGHSARDTFRMLKEINISMIRKPFAVGVRIEHLQSDMNKALYGDFANHPSLSAADYKLAVHLPSSRGVYTFCMCPGGYVVNASSEEGRIAVNGMSYSARDGKNANSALLTEVLPEDLEGDDILEGIEFQRQIEDAAYKLTGGKGVPVQTVGGYLYGKNEVSTIKPTVLPKPVFAEISEIFPDFINDSLRCGILELGKKLSGFDNPCAILTAPESRSSSPIRILRNEKLNSVSAEGVYPCGEGAGYAGGIMSAAVDGIKCAEAVVDEILTQMS